MSVECLRYENSVNIVIDDGNKYVFNGSSYDEDKKYGMYNGTYVFKDVPSAHPMYIK